MNIVKQRRREKGWSQEHLAEVSGVSRASIQRLEVGKRRPSPEIAMAVANALEIPAGKIQMQSGVRAAVVALMQSCLDRSPTPKELARLPEWEWPRH